MCSSLSPLVAFCSQAALSAGTTLVRVLCRVFWLIGIFTTESPIDRRPRAVAAAAGTRHRSMRSFRRDRRSLLLLRHHRSEGHPTATPARGSSPCCWRYRPCMVAAEAVRFARVGWGKPFAVSLLPTPWFRTSSRSSPFVCGTRAGEAYVVPPDIPHHRIVVASKVRHRLPEVTSRCRRPRPFSDAGESGTGAPEAARGPRTGTTSTVRYRVGRPWSARPSPQSPACAPRRPASTRSCRKPTARPAAIGATSRPTPAAADPQAADSSTAPFPAASRTRSTAGRTATPRRRSSERPRRKRSETRRRRRQ
mmetsp:Transcript_7427/g.18207  ORF Transcript_7427/g.18207 Transcript_7427/m.18207 type:complete len:308 (+) Transcript_7427:369-1292(+)